MSLSSAPAEIALQQAVTHHQRGRLNEAEALYRMALKLHPGHAAAGRNLLAAMFMSGRYAEMESAAQEMVAAAPRFGIAWKGMGLARLMQGKDAVDAFRMAANHLPDDAESHENLGLALKRAGRLAEAAASLQRAVAINPGSPGSQVNLGNMLKECGQFAQAFACYQRALERRPGMPEALYNLGRLLKDVGRAADAETCFRQALHGKPDHAEAHYHLATVLVDLGRAREASESIRRAIDLAPDHAVFRIGQAVLKLPAVAASTEEAESGAAGFARALEDLPASMASAPSWRMDAAALPMPLHLASRKGNHVDALSRFGDLFAGKEVRTIAPAGGRTKIRLAIVSSHFRRHPVWEINIKGLLQHIDRARFDIALYYLDRIEDEETALARSLADLWRDAGTTPGFDAWQQALEDDRPDAIFYPELGMEPLAYHLACRRLAPFQAAGWGHPVTSGLPTIDAYFSGELIEAPEADAHYRERLVRLPGTGSCNAPDLPLPEAAPELDAKLATHCGCRFLIAQTPFKVDPSDDALFAAIASDVPGSTFILLSHPQFPHATERLLARMGDAFRSRGLQPENRLLVLPWLSQPQFQSLLDRCDVYLDCPSFSGYMTARMALGRGVPVVTLEGSFMRQRLASGLLRAIGLDETVCASEDAYRAAAVRLAQECSGPAQRDARRERLKAASVRADKDMRVVRAFEQCVAAALDQGSSPDVTA